jgi:pSer/pThr/pTyr-binding forkhead associated (FHA) protein
MEFMAKIQVLEGPMKGVEFEIDKEVLFVGRSPGNDIQLRDNLVSRKHLKIFRVESCYFIEDLKARNGSMINGEPLDPGFAQLITENDLIQLGSSVIRFDGIGANKPPITVEDIEPPSREKRKEPRSSIAYSGEERRSREFRGMNLIYDLLQLMGETSDTNELLKKVTESLFESYPRIDKVSAFLFDDGKNSMEEIVSRSRQDGAKKRTSYTKAILDQVIQDGKIATAYLKTDAARDGFTNDLDTVEHMAVICLPLMASEKIHGTIYIEGFGESNPVRKEDFLLLKTIKRLFELNFQMGDLNRGTGHTRETAKDSESK